MAEYKTLQFPSTPAGQAEKVRALRVHTDAGWTVESETIQPRSVDLDTAVCGGMFGWCCCGPVGLSTALKGAQSDAVITLTLRAPLSGAPLDSQIGRALTIHDGDPMLKDAARIAVQRRTASTSLLQRELKIGYARASRLMDELRGVGVISAHGSESSVLISTLVELDTLFESGKL